MAILNISSNLAEIELMLMLLFYVNNQRYALASQQIVEVIPLVNLTQISHTSEYFAGVFNYRGRIVPVIDLCQLMSSQRCCERFSTRIILVSYENKGNQATTSSPQSHQVLGLMAEKVVETLHKSAIELVNLNIQVDTPPYLGSMIVDEQGMIQCLQVEYLLPAVDQVYLLPQSLKH